MISKKINNVKVMSFELKDFPAMLKYNVKVNKTEYFSEITYDSINQWEDVKSRLLNEGIFLSLITTIIIWDAMRFMALGGEELILCNSLAVSDDLCEKWRYCFINQFGEWRYKNDFKYSSIQYPKITQCTSLNINNKNHKYLKKSMIDKEKKWLIANGGGKDSLAGMLLLKEAGIRFNVYEGYLPMGADWETQKNLLAEIRNSICKGNNEVISIKIKDDFYNRDDKLFIEDGVEAEHYKTDFAVGHTANYIGYFPIIIAHEFDHVWFNIEASADRVMKRWNGQDINHQWCKSTEYQKISGEIFNHITGLDFGGFKSTIRGLHDTQIYAIASNDKESLMKSHSCNIKKPWCAKCAKCCFSYLMMSAMVDEIFAKKTMKLEHGLFDDIEIQAEWQALLDSELVAWECVPSHQECINALRKCISKGYAKNLLSYVKEPIMDDDYTFRRVGWDKIPNQIREAAAQAILGSGNVIYNDVIVIGAGQAGLGMSYLLQKENTNHIVLEAGSIGGSWKNRWDSFQLNTPNLTVSLPGKNWEVDKGQGFMTHDETRNYLEEYASESNLPILNDTIAQKITKNNDLFRVETNRGVFLSKQLIIASGEYAEVKIPHFSEDVLSSVNVIHSRDYKNPHQIEGKNVLVIGGGQSGAQIAEELSNDGLNVFWSISSRPSNIRRLRGKDFMEWWDIGGIIHKHIDEYPSDLLKDKKEFKKLKDMEFPLVSGYKNNGLGKSISLKKMVESGIILLDKYISSNKETLCFGDNIKESIKKSIRGTAEQFAILNAVADIYYKDKFEPNFEEEEFIPDEIRMDWDYDQEIREIDVKKQKIKTIICATGYKKSWDWIDIEGAFDENGYPIGKNSKSDISGLYFLGLFNTPRLSTTCLCNGGRDAADILEEIIKFKRD